MGKEKDAVWIEGEEHKEKEPVVGWGDASGWLVTLIRPRGSVQGIGIRYFIWAKPRYIKDIQMK